MSVVFDEQLKSWSEKAAGEFVPLAEKGVTLSVHFLLGSYVDDDIHVAHIAKCPLPDTVNAEDGDKSSKTVDAEWMRDNAEKVIRMLPGGISVVGAGVVCSKKALTEQRSMIMNAFGRIHKMNSTLATLDLAPLPSKMAIVHVEHPTKKVSVSLSDVVHRGPDSPSRVTFSSLQWISLVTRLAFDIRTAIPLDKKKTDDFYLQFRSAMRPWVERVFGSNLVSFDNEITNDSQQLISDLKKSKSSINVKFYAACQNTKSSVVVREGFELFELNADLAIRACVSQKATVRDARNAIRDHAVRNLLARASLQYESMELVEGQTRASPSLHQLPRAATTVLPSQPAILFFDFLFDGDSTDDAAKNFEQVLCLTPGPEQVDDLWERNLTAEEVEVPPLTSKHARPSPSFSLWYIFIAILVLILAVVIYAMRGK